MNEMCPKKILRIDVLETNEILIAKDLPKTLLVSQLKTISIYKIQSLLQNQTNFYISIRAAKNIPFENEKI